MLDGGDKIEFSDRIKDSFRRFAAKDNGSKVPPSPPSPLTASENPSSGVTDAVVVASPVDRWQGVPPPMCPAEAHGAEISRAQAASKKGVRLRDYVGRVGKVVKALYATRYGEQAARDIPTR